MPVKCCISNVGRCPRMPLVVITSMQMAEVSIISRGAKRIRNGHLWVYRSDVVESRLVGIEGGAIVRVVDQAHNFVGQAFYSDASEIALRFLTTHEETIDREWWRLHLRACAVRRSRIAADTNAYRLVYSEGDLLPSLIIDKYDDVFVIQTLSQGSEQVKATIAELLVEEFKPDAIVERNDARVRQLEGLELTKRRHLMRWQNPESPATAARWRVCSSTTLWI